MIDAFATRQLQTARRQERRSNISWWLMLFGLLGISVATSLLMIRNRPSVSTIAWLIYVSGIIAIFYKPRYGIYLLLGFTMFGDANLHSWYPFTKNFSSWESLLYLNNSLIISPLETYIVFTAVSWFGRMAMERRIRLYLGPLLFPAALFLSFVTYGLAYGLARGGNLVIALWEARSIYYLLALLILTSNLIKTREQLNRLFWVISIALFFKGISGVIYVATVLKWDTGSVERIAEHSMSIHFNLFFVLMLCAWVYRDKLSRRLMMPLMAPVILYSFLANHRRAGFLTIAIAVLIIVILLYREHRKAFWAIAPTGTVGFLAYLAAFWNNEGSIGMMARAVRSVIGKPTARDAASNIYRDIENVNIMFTIKQTTLTGVGFGQKFYIIAPLPDISFFEWWEYITHNSVMWIWMKIGMGGFFGLLMLVGMTMIVGGRLVRTMPSGRMRSFALVATLYVLMHFTYAYVDMSWDTNSLVLVGTMMGVINCLDQIAAQPVPLPARRWPWQPDPTPDNLRPLGPRRLTRPPARAESAPAPDVSPRYGVPGLRQ